MSKEIEYEVVPVEDLTPAQAYHAKAAEPSPSTEAGAVALGGKAANVLYDGERRFDIRVRYQKDFRKSQSEIENLLVPSNDNQKVPLKNIANFKTITGSIH